MDFLNWYGFGKVIGYTCYKMDETNNLNQRKNKMDCKNCVYCNKETVSLGDENSGVNWTCFKRRKLVHEDYYNEEGGIEDSTYWEYEKDYVRIKEGNEYENFDLGICEHYK